MTVIEDVRVVPSGEGSVEVAVVVAAEASVCAAGLAVTAVDSRGRAAPDPTTWSPRVVPEEPLRPGNVTSWRPRQPSSTTLELDLFDHVWIDTPGTWTVGVEGVTTTVELGPDDLPRAPGPTATVRELLAWPSTATSAVLLDLLEGDPTPADRLDILFWLPARIQDPWLRERSWNEELDARVLDLARRLLTAHGPGDPRFVEAVMARLAEPADAPALIAAQPHRPGFGRPYLPTILRLGAAPLLEPGVLVEQLPSWMDGFPATAIASGLIDRVEAGVDVERDMALIPRTMDTDVCATIDGVPDTSPAERARLVSVWREALAERGEGALVFDPDHSDLLLPSGLRCVPRSVEHTPPLAAPREQDLPGDPIADDELITGALGVTMLRDRLEGHRLGPVPFTWDGGATTEAWVTVRLAPGSGRVIRWDPSPVRPSPCGNPNLGGSVMGEVPSELLLVWAEVSLTTVDGRLSRTWEATLTAQRSIGTHVTWQVTDGSERPRRYGYGPPKLQIDGWGDEIDHIVLSRGRRRRWRGGYDPELGML
ncbi:MAG: hypothetical protein H6738_24225 [Alphaproteobacteria bacterium]|nr:hypothetical protein [Alphaproteobacteria bacterium]